MDGNGARCTSQSRSFKTLDRHPQGLYNLSTENEFLYLHGVGEI
jgi:hypothetical protein